MVEALRCSQCSAPVQDDRWTNCPYCGAVLAKATIDPLRAMVAPERFAAAARSPSYAGLMRHEPRSGGKLLGLGARTAFLVLWTLIAGLMTLFFYAHAGFLALAPGLMFLAGVFQVTKSWSRAASFAGAPLERRLAVWRDERTEVSGGGKDTSATTTHFVLLQDHEGRRSEHECEGSIAGANAPGDLGVAYLRDGVLLDFRRIDA